MFPVKDSPVRGLDGQSAPSPGEELGLCRYTVVPKLCENKKNREKHVDDFSGVSGNWVPNRTYHRLNIGGPWEGPL